MGNVVKIDELGRTNLEIREKDERCKVDNKTVFGRGRFALSLLGGLCDPLALEPEVRYTEMGSLGAMIARGIIILRQTGNKL